MRKLADLSGALFIVLGLLFSFGGFLSLNTVRSAGVLAWFGVALILIGWLMSRSANRKNCPQCQEPINFKALKCKHCGSGLQ